MSNDDFQGSTYEQSAACFKTMLKQIPPCCEKLFSLVKWDRLPFSNNGIFGQMPMTFQKILLMVEPVTFAASGASTSSSTSSRTSTFRASPAGSTSGTATQDFPTSRLE